LHEILTMVVNESLNTGLVYYFV